MAGGKLDHGESSVVEISPSRKGSWNVWAVAVRERDLTAYGNGARATLSETMAPHVWSGVRYDRGEGIGNVNWTVRIFTGHKGWPSLRRDSYRTRGH